MWWLYVFMFECFLLSLRSHSIATSTCGGYVVMAVCVCVCVRVLLVEFAQS